MGALGQYVAELLLALTIAIAIPWSVYNARVFYATYRLVKVVNSINKRLEKNERRR